jgi:hypothetical protein
MDNVQRTLRSTLFVDNNKKTFLFGVWLFLVVFHWCGLGFYFFPFLNWFGLNEFLG